MERKVTIKNESGIHARPAALLVKKASEFESKVEIDFNGKKVNAKSIMGIMSLGASKGSEITVITDGSDEDKAVNAVAELIEGGFGEA
ncbi:phosphocarrier protein HPr [Tepidibacter aestuarii]|uniref:phosphocarrier protein HPr n=1 Tax=Tepidibacter aestuarii TaxID=2925782 RepID=UPI0020C07591|nr:phosphocarrier protein HPr [Tepidibacter aestuarii]CAH2212684.1 histidine-containing phosphocarrier protein of the phosphotransferase system (PTS) (HPr protein) [Tepidibacter aestuarii]